MKHFTRTFLIIGALAGSADATAIDNACRPIVDASKAEWRAPMVHDRKVLKDGFTYEIIKLDDNFYMKTGGAWRKMPAPMTKILTDPEAIEKVSLQMQDCKETGSEVIGEVPTIVYSFTSTVAKANPNAGTSRVWIGKDGLPYRQEGGDFKATMVYTGVTAPTIRK